MTINDFDWSTNNESVVGITTPGVAAYLNAANNIVIRNERDGFVYDEDPFVVVAFSMIPKLIQVLEELRVQAAQSNE